MLHKILLAVVLLGIGQAVAGAADRPNIVWLLSEDNAAEYLNLYKPAGAKTPAIEALAKEGLVFEHAFSNAPVCSTARTTLMTSCYLPRFGAQFHRPTGRPELPFGLKMFPAYLREAGYFTTNNSKTDYNVVVGKEVWDESSRKATWRKRPRAGMPFFHMQSFGESHESSLHPNGFKPDKPTTHDPAAVELPPHYPDTKLFRKTWAYYLDRMQVIDRRVAKVVAQLKEDGLYDDTIIFYFGDHGGVLPRSKGYIYDTGLHVPLVVRVPKKWQFRIPHPRGSRVTGFVSFVDFGATVLRLADLEVPEKMDGRPFLGPGANADEVNARNTTFSYADRFDEQFNFKRAFRRGRYKYIRHFTPYYPDAILNAYRNRMLAVQQWYSLHAAGKLNAVQDQFFQPRAAEALYDLQADPYELHNLIDDPAHADTAAELRAALRAKMIALPDSGVYPESEVAARVQKDPAAFVTQRSQVTRLLELSDLALRPYEQSADAIARSLVDDDPLVRYWGLIAAAAHGPAAKDQTATIMATARQEKHVYNLCRAIEFLAVTNQPDLVQQATTIAKLRARDASRPDRMLLENTLGFVRDFHPGE